MARSSDYELRNRKEKFDDILNWLTRVMMENSKHKGSSPTKSTENDPWAWLKPYYDAEYDPTLESSPPTTLRKEALDDFQWWANLRSHNSSTSKASRYSSDKRQSSLSPVLHNFSFTCTCFFCSVDPYSDSASHKSEKSSFKFSMIITFLTEKFSQLLVRDDESYTEEISEDPDLPVISSNDSTEKTSSARLLWSTIFIAFIVPLLFLIVTKWFGL